jgi:DnaJ-class molecular chaperone
MIPEDSIICSFCEGLGWSLRGVGGGDSVQDECPECQGFGFIYLGATCPKCHGKKVVEDHFIVQGLRVTGTYPCKFCKGTGEVQADSEI